MLRKVVFAVFSFVSVALVGAESVPEYVVTASRESREAMDEPARVTVITAEDIERSGKTNVVEVLESVPGVRFTSLAGEAQAQVSMRGFGENSYARVKVLVDGRELNNPDQSGLNWLSIPVGTIERIEVLDGPASVLYGSGAVGGVINVITKKPPMGVSAGASASYGSFNTTRLLLNTSYGQETAGLSLSADLYRTDGYRKRSGGTDVNVNLSGLVNLGESLTVRPSFGYADIGFFLPGSLTKAQFEADPTQASTLQDVGTERNATAGIVLQWAVDERADADLPLTYAYKNRSATYVTYASVYDYEQHQFAAKPKASWEGELPFATVSLVGGADYDGSAYTATYWGDLAKTALNAKNAFFQHSIAPYLCGRMAFDGGLSVDAGARYGWNWLSVNDEKLGVTNRKDTGSFAYAIALTWRPVKEFSAYARHDSIYRNPLVDEIVTFDYMTGNSAYNPDLAAESGYNFELGATWVPAREFSAKANAYCLFMTNEIAWGITRNENLDATRHLGGALDLSYSPFEFLEARGNVALSLTTFTSGANAGKTVPLVPALTAGGELIARLPAGFALSANGSYTGDYYKGGDSANAFEKIDGYFLMGAGVEFIPPALGGKLAIRASGSNLLDTSYCPYVYYSGYYPAPGRSFTVSATYTY
jgi:iron complex outermembrane recepter protein